MKTRLNVPALRNRLCAGPCVVYFVKRDGSPRRMVTAPGAEACRALTLKDGAPALRLFDVEAGAYRTVNLVTVYRVRQLRATRHAPVRPVRPASAPARVVTTPARPSVAAPFSAGATSADDFEAWADDFDLGFRGAPNARIR